MNVCVLQTFFFKWAHLVWNKCYYFVVHHRRNVEVNFESNDMVRYGESPLQYGELYFSLFEIKKIADVKKLVYYS